MNPSDDSSVVLEDSTCSITPALFVNSYISIDMITPIVIECTGVDYQTTRGDVLDTDDVIDCDNYKSGDDASVISQPHHSSLHPPEIEPLIPSPDIHEYSSEADKFNSDSLLVLDEISMLTRKRLQDIDNDLQNSELKYRRHSVVVKEEHQVRGLPHQHCLLFADHPTNLVSTLSIINDSAY